MLHNGNPMRNAGEAQPGGPAAKSGEPFMLYLCPVIWRLHRPVQLFSDV